MPFHCAAAKRLRALLAYVLCIVAGAGASCPAYEKACDFDTLRQNGRATCYLSGRSPDPTYYSPSLSSITLDHLFTPNNNCPVFADGSTGITVYLETCMEVAKALS